MVFPKRIYYGFKDFQPSSLPKGSRSSRGRRAAPGNIDRGNDMFAFNLLATVAGNLLNDKETQDQPSNLTAKEMKSIVKHELQNDNELPKFEPCDQGSCDEGKPNCETLCKPFISQGFVMKDCSEASSSVVVPPVVAKLEANEKSSYESTVDTGKIDKQASLSAECEKDGDAGSGNRFRSDEIITNLLCAEDIQDLDLKPPPNLVSSDSSVELPPYQKQNYTGFDTSIPNRRVGVKFSNRYNDQNSSRCYPSDIINSNGFKSQCIGGDRKIKKSSEAVFRKVKTSRQNETKCMFRSGQMYYAGQKIQKSSFKRRKFFERFTSASHQGEMKSDMFSMSPEKSLKGETSSSATALNAQTLKLKPDEHNVKCSIKSFMVPEVIINMPDSATIGELKRRTEDALTNLLHYGLQVGIALQGKKISDDSKTLHQIGITDTAKFGSLGFSLEVNSDYQHCPQPSDASEPVSWFPVSVPSDICMKGTQEDFTCQPDAARIIKKPKTGFDLFPLAKTEMQDTSKEDVNALAVVPVLNSDPLSVIPLRKSKRSELVQRRIRRPFSVSEVEALVHAVEKLGTGRWRDVKIRAFDNAKHRTYVDLKDKWKTLVHTARISPQQRRGEPVPQELLDRVLSAHAYWSQQQARSQIKHEPEQHILA